MFVLLEEDPRKRASIAFTPPDVATYRRSGLCCNDVCCGQADSVLGRVAEALLSMDRLDEALGYTPGYTLCIFFKALHNKDTLHITHYIIRTLA